MTRPTLAEADQSLVTQLRNLGDAYGPLGVACVAADLTDHDVLARELGLAVPGQELRRARASADSTAIAVVTTVMVFAIASPAIGWLLGVAVRLFQAAR